MGTVRTLQRRLKHRLEYAGFRAALGANAALSDDAAARVGEWLGGLGYPLGIKRRIVERNLRLAFPERDEAWVARVARASYEHLGRETLMMLRLSSATREQVIERTVVDVESAAFQAYHEGRGVVVVAGHLGNWELGAAMVAVRGFRLDAIAKRAANPFFYDYILAARARLGVHVIDMHHARGQALRSLRSGRAVAFAADQHAGRSGVRVPFFGRPTAMFRGPAVMALRTGAPIFLSVPIRLPDGRYRMELLPIDAAPTEDTEADVARITAAWAAQLEQAVRQYPEQYLWQHRRWRDVEPESEQAGAATV